MKLEFTKTPHNSIRVYLYYDNSEERDRMMPIFNYLSAWKGADIWEPDIKMKSWEFPGTLEDYFRKRYPTEWI